jgi:glucuronate isomerase
MAKKNNFIHPDFLLQNPPARRLYHEFAAALPIVDFHSHLPPSQIAEDRRFENLTQIWLAGDHYKWRAMRANGVAEKYCTGSASDWAKFEKWAETITHCPLNPLYHWTHLELNRPFGIHDRLLNPDTAREIWDKCNAQLARPDFSCRGILRQMRVALVCTTDDPADALTYHQAIAADRHREFQVLPTWRPDKALLVDQPGPYRAYLDTLAEAAGVEINNYAALLKALRKRHDFFHQQGCRLADHGLDTFYADDYTEAEVAKIFAKARSGKPASPEETSRFKSALLYQLGVLDCDKGWTQQFHIGPIRNNNSRLYHQLGPDAGFDSIGDAAYAVPMARFLDRLDRDNKLAKTILYNINPRDNELIATMLGNFQDGSIPGKIQMGSAWWFLDQKDGIEKQLLCLGNLGLLSRFVGMVTDSRSFLSYARHEYFRRILCNLLGNEMRQGTLPLDYALIGQLVKNVCYRNAATYFGFDLKPVV